MATYTCFLAKNKADKFLVYADKFYSSYRNELVAFEQVLYQDMMSMLQLLQTIARAKKQNVLVVSHGSTNGLWLPLVAKSKDISTTDRLVTFMLMSRMHNIVKRLTSDSAPDKWFADQKSRTGMLADLATVFPAHDFIFKTDEDAFKALNSATTGKPGKALSSIQDQVNTTRDASTLAQLGPIAQTAVRDWWASLLKSSNLTDERTAQSYFDAIRDVHATHISSVEIRGCNVGASAPSSQVLRRFLGASKLRAPTETIVTENPTAGVETKEVVKKSEIRWDVDGGYVKWTPGGAYRTTSLKAWENWVNQKIGKPRGKVALNMPLMSLEKVLYGSPVYPQDQGFADLLATFE
jgi:hypothetical protein